MTSGKIGLLHLVYNKQLEQADLLSYLVNQHGDEHTTQPDIVMAGYAVHHLSLPDKNKFFSMAHSTLAKDGTLIFYDNSRRPDESRDEHVAAYFDMMTTEWDSRWTGSAARTNTSRTAISLSRQRRSCTWPVMPDSQAHQRNCLQTTRSTKDFDLIKGDYAFFEDHSTEAHEDLAGYRAILKSTFVGRSQPGPVRVLDFGSGPGNFTARFLKLFARPQMSLSLALVEPVAVYREQAENFLAEFTGQPIRAFANRESCHESRFDVVLANHVFYYVSNPHTTLSWLLAALAPGGVFMTSIAGPDNTLIHFWQVCFAMMGKPVPYKTSEDVQQVFAALGVTASTQKIHYRLEFPDTAENRSSILRFLLADYFQELPREHILNLFEPCVTKSGMVSMNIQHDQFWVVKNGDSQPQ